MTAFHSPKMPLPLRRSARCRASVAKVLAAAFASTLCVAAQALEIVISEGWDSPTRIAVVPFGGPPLRDGPGPVRPTDIAGVVSFDLRRSGQFEAVAPEQMLQHPTTPEAVSFRDWRIQQVDYLVIGRTWAAPNGEVSVLYRLLDVTAEREIGSARFTVATARVRDVAHRISDEIYERITGIRGAFSTKILYVLVEGPNTRSPIYRLLMADADGQRERTLFRSSEPILSPSWSPDSQRVAYVSFETGRSTIIVQNVDDGSREQVAAYRGINGAPAFSPDGKQLAMSLSRDGNSEIYVKDLQSGELRRVTRNPSAIDTEPSWSANGDSLIFTSDRGGRPQIYRLDLATGYPERLTFRGDYNARARLLPDGRHLVYVHRRSGTYHIAWQDLEREAVHLLTETALDESPSLAPNGTMMMYATQQQGRGILAVVSIDGRVKYTLPSAAGDVREPAWSPFIDALALGPG